MHAKFEGTSVPEFLECNRVMPKTPCVHDRVINASCAKFMNLIVRFFSFLFSFRCLSYTNYGIA